MNNEKNKIENKKKAKQKKIITNMDIDAYKLLRNGLKEIATDEDKQSFLKVLINMNPLNNVDFTNYKQFEVLMEETKIESRCVYNHSETTGGFKCICGQERLRVLGVVEYNGLNYILGSECVKNLKKMVEEREADPSLIIKLDKWIDSIKVVDNQKNNSCCLACGKKSISKTDYIDVRRKIWCKKCLYSKNEWIKGKLKSVQYAPCKSCKKHFKPHDKKWLDYRGQVKTQCVDCWKKTH